MNRDDIQLLYRYNRWANATILNAVAPLSKDDFSRKLGGSFPSARETLVHIMGAEWIWLRRWKGLSPPALLSGAEFTDLISFKFWELFSAAALNPRVKVTRIKVTYPRFFSAFGRRGQWN